MSGNEERAHHQEIERLKKPENIRESVYASSPHGFRTSLTKVRMAECNSKVGED